MINLGIHIQNEKNIQDCYHQILKNTRKNKNKYINKTNNK